MIVAGFGRMGTLSTARALTILGFGPCHHMYEVVARPGSERPWRAAAGGAPVDWSAVLAGYGSAADWPAGAFWRELAEHFPAAKVVLLTRDPASWRASANRMFGEAMTAFDTPDLAPLAAMVGEVGAFQRRQMLAALGADDDGARAPAHPSGAPLLRDEAHAAAIVDQYTGMVRAGIAPERLLDYRVQDGWAPLCAALGVPVPDVPFPHLNEAGAYRDHLRAALARREGGERPCGC